mmetsp:Transcript_107867/g.305720  ORF Transcript_107867/g.305720 Transcript_107867/m.305720 type:complete len:619 (-) Transcript_107867:2178-4034(-)
MHVQLQGHGRHAHRGIRGRWLEGLGRLLADRRQRRGSCGGVLSRSHAVAAEVQDGLREGQPVQASGVRPAALVHRGLGEHQGAGAAGRVGAREARRVARCARRGGDAHVRAPVGQLGLPEPLPRAARPPEATSTFCGTAILDRERPLRGRAARGRPGRHVPVGYARRGSRGRHRREAHVREGHTRVALLRLLNQLLEALGRAAPPGRGPAPPAREAGRGGSRPGARSCNRERGRRGGRCRGHRRHPWQRRRQHGRLRRPVRGQSCGRRRAEGGHGRLGAAHRLRRGAWRVAEGLVVRLVVRERLDVLGERVGAGRRRRPVLRGARVDDGEPLHGLRVLDGEYVLAVHRVGPAHEALPAGAAAHAAAGHEQADAHEDPGVEGVFARLGPRRHDGVVHLERAALQGLQHVGPDATAATLCGAGVAKAQPVGPSGGERDGVDPVATDDLGVVAPVLIARGPAEVLLRVSALVVATHDQHPVRHGGQPRALDGDLERGVHRDGGWVRVDSLGRRQRARILVARPLLREHGRARFAVAEGLGDDITAPHLHTAVARPAAVACLHPVGEDAVGHVVHGDLPKPDRIARGQRANVVQAAAPADVAGDPSWSANQQNVLPGLMRGV